MESHYEIKKAEVEARMKELGNELKTKMPEGMGFALLMFDYRKEGNTFYVSSANREDTIKAFEEFIAKLKSYG